MQSCMIISNATRRPSMLANMVKAAASWAHVWFATRIGAETETETGRLRDACYTKEELEQIVVRYKDMVYRLAVMRMKNSSLADDIFQETFLRLVRQRKRLESEEMLKAWLIRVTINCCNDHYRSAWNRKIVSFMDDRKKDSADDENEVYDSALDDDGYDPFESDNPLAEATYDAVQALPDALRTVIHLFYYENLSVREISKILGARENAVKTRLSRARNALKGKLEGLYHG